MEQTEQSRKQLEACQSTEQQPSVQSIGPERVCEILVVEDTPAVAETLAEILQDYGFRPVVAPSAEKALSHLQWSRLPDLILLDLVLPGLDGPGFLRRIRRHPVHRDIPVVVVSAVCQQDDAARLGVAACLTKPIVVESLLAAITAHCCARPVPQE